MNRIAVIIGAMTISIVVSLGCLACRYYSAATEFKKQRNEKAQELKLAHEAINDMQVRQRDVAALDAKYTGELNNAQAIINQLQRDVIAGRKRLQLNATCAKSGTASTGSVGDATSARLNDTAERDYFTLRGRINTITGQVNYLQQYIREQCLK